MNKLGEGNLLAEFTMLPTNIAKDDGSGGDKWSYNILIVNLAHGTKEIARPTIS